MAASKQARRLLLCSQLMACGRSYNGAVPRLGPAYLKSRPPGPSFEEQLTQSPSLELALCGRAGLVLASAGLESRLPLRPA